MNERLLLCRQHFSRTVSAVCLCVFASTALAIGVVIVRDWFRTKLKPSNYSR
ncbi:unnamed protein product [Ectocarpus sp. 12 AP-2014]